MLANDVRRNSTHSSGTDDDVVLRAPVRNEMYWLTSIRRRCSHTLLSTVFKACGFVLVGEKMNNNYDVVLL